MQKHEHERRLTHTKIRNDTNCTYDRISFLLFSVKSNKQDKLEKKIINMNVIIKKKRILTNIINISEHEHHLNNNINK